MLSENTPDVGPGQICRAGNSCRAPVACLGEASLGFVPVWVSARAKKRIKDPICAELHSERSNLDRLPLIEVAARNDHRPKRRAALHCNNVSSAICLAAFEQQDK